MKTTVSAAELQAQNIELNKRNAELENTVTELSALVKHLQELFKLSQQKRFAASSEKSEGQFTLFGDIDSAMPEIVVPETEEITYKRRKQKGKREADLSKLPLEIVEHELPEGERKCPDCNDLMGEIGVTTRDELKIVPAQVVRVQHRAKTYKCKVCAETTEKTPIIKARMPKPLISGSIASASAVAHIMTQKHLMHLPFYRMEQDFVRQGVLISRQNMANWTIQVCENWLAPIYDKLRHNLLQHKVLHADETTFQVLKEPGKTAQQKSYMWLYRTGGESVCQTVLYEYQPDRSGQRPKTFLHSWRGFCHTDGYSAYKNLPNVTLVGCWAHTRRKFDEAYKISKVEHSPAKIGLDYCNQLFALEREFSEMLPEERFEARMKQSFPIAEAFFAWAKSVNMLPKLAITRALGYAIRQEMYLMNVFADGRLELSNNRAERSIKPVVLGRKNWLFANSVRGAKASVMAFSIIETAKENGLKPFEYLNFLLETLPDATTSRLDELLPWGSAVPDYCRLES